MVAVRDEPSTADRPYVFVKDDDGRLWLNYWSGNAWRWSPQGKPPGDRVDLGLGVVGRYNGKGSEWPVVFVRGQSKKLWTHVWDGTSWVWNDQGTPPGTNVEGSVAAITVNDEPGEAERPYVFVRGQDNHLWTRWWNGISWRWTDQGMPPESQGVAQGLGGVSVDNLRPEIFVKARDNRMWANRWTGTAWAWEERGVPSERPTNLVGISTGLGAITVKDGPHSRARPYVFVQGTDTDVWVDWLGEI